jgi:hypothetical protein
MNTSTEGTRKCDFCEEEISYYSRRCPYCGSLLKPPELSADYASDYASSPVGDDFQIERDRVNEEIPAGADANQAANENYSNHMYSVYKPLSNAMKVFLTSIAVIIPGIGQLIGIIAAIVFLNSGHDGDRRSFGVALLVASVIFFILSGILMFFMLIAVFTQRIGY